MTSTPLTSLPQPQRSGPMGRSNTPQCWVPNFWASPTGASNEHPDTYDTQLSGELAWGL